MRPQSLRSGTRPGRRPRGIALLMALAVVMLLTFFMSEYFFATGLELRGMTTFKDAQQARMLSRAVFKAVQVGLLQDEVDFFDGYNELATLLTVAAVPWNNGLLLTLDIAPQDHLYNLNQDYNQQQGEDTDVARRGLFVRTLEDLEVVTDPATQTTAPIDLDVLYELHATLFDWIDSDSEDYTDIPGVLGGEAHAYFNSEPEVQIKNGQLDRLEEIRLVRGVLASRIPWGYWEQRFTALPRVTDSTFYFTEKINVNLASREEIQRFLEHRWVDPNTIVASNFQAIQTGINDYADNAQLVAEALAPAPEEDGEREVFDQKKLKERLKELQLNENYGVNFLFSTVNEYYRVRIVTEVAGVKARLEAMLNVPRDAETRVGSVPKILWVTLE